MQNIKTFLLEITYPSLVSCFLISNSILPIIEHKYAIVISIIAVILTKV